MQERTHFGFKTVDAEDKSSLVRGVFDSVASKYDIMNDLMSGGLHRLWKQEMVAWLNPAAGMRIIDVAGGTGDIALRILDRADCEVTIADINKEMLMEGRNNAVDHNRLSVEFICADAEKLPVPDGHFDAYTIAFGIRNVTHIEQALKEAYRVLKPGGRFMCLEFSQVKNPLLRHVYDAYSFHVIPQIGRMVTGDKDAYQYLVESIRRFPPQEKFAQMMRIAGFGNVQYRSLTHGVVAIHSGRRL